MILNPGSCQSSVFYQGPYFPFPGEGMRPRDSKIAGHERWVEPEDGERGYEVSTNTGLLGYHDSKGDLASKVHEPAERYGEKFGRRPNSFYVNPASLPNNASKSSARGIKVVTKPTILPDRFWVGVEGRNRSRKAHTAE